MKLPRSRAGRARLDASSGSDESRHWLTLAPVNDRERRISTALRIAAPLLEDGQLDYVAATLLEYAATRGPDCEAEWLSMLAELFDEAGLPICGVDSHPPGGADQSARTSSAAADDWHDSIDVSILLSELRRQKLVCGRPPPPPPLQVGDAVLAILREDGEWHEAVLQPPSAASSLPGSVPGSVLSGSLVVLFVEWGALQVVSAEEVQPVVASDADAQELPGTCKLCGRSTTLTFHHLIPKETHGRYLGKALPALPPGVVEGGAAPTRQWLSHYGAALCRPCHTVVHRLAPNAVLAQRFNSVQVLKEEPSIERWVRFAAKSKC